MAVRVGCNECSWRGKRTFKDCDCYGKCNCPAYGHCPKCGEILMTMRIIKLYKQVNKDRQRMNTV